tara:strand:- start:202 stop:585 length:384 start_codon:yes stop_codon:yes gene_type:complete
MELTGKAKEQFEEWYLRIFWKAEKEGQGLITINKGGIGLLRFYYLPEAMQFGVYVDFADSVGMLIDTDVVWDVITLNKNIYEYTIKNQQELLVLGDGFAYTRRELRTAAIKRLNKILNKKQENEKTK